MTCVDQVRFSCFSPVGPEIHVVGSFFTNGSGVGVFFTLGARDGMEAAAEHRFSGPATVFQDRHLPEPATPAGYSALIDAFGLQVPLPRTLSAIGAHHRSVERAGWRIVTPRHAPRASLAGHLAFALKYEGVDLAVLKRLFLATGPGPIEALVRERPAGRYARTIWFLFEWLTGASLDLPDARSGRIVPVVDPDLQYAVPGEYVSRCRVRNNLPGIPDFCPLVFRTGTLDRFIGRNLPERARAVIAEVPRDRLAHAAAFLLVKDSRSSFAIEGERPTGDRVQRWGRAIGEAGRRTLDRDELLRLQRIVLGDGRFTRMGFRRDGGFVGVHDRETRAPLPDHISARPEDLPSLIDGMIAFDRGPVHALDPVIAAAALAFGFVYVHPFEDGNGRLHRFLIHHVLAERGYNPSGVVFPVSAAILDRIDAYRRVLESYSQRLLPLIAWRPTPEFNVHVLNDTGDFYRYFDATPQAEFLYSCVAKTIDEDLPAEVGFLRRYDMFRQGVGSFLDMPERTIDLLFRFVSQNSGHLSQRARAREFSALTSDEVTQIECIYRDVFLDQEC